MTDDTAETEAVAPGPDARQPTRRGPGRPRREIALTEVADTAVQLFAEGGYDAVSVEASRRTSFGLSRNSLPHRRDKGRPARNRPGATPLKGSAPEPPS